MTVGVMLGVTVGVALGVTVGVTEGVGVEGGVGVGEQRPPGSWHQLTSTVSTRQPSFEPLLSLAILHRSVPSMISAGR